MLRARAEGGQRCSRIESLDPFLRDYESEYHYLFKRVHEASALPTGQPLAVYYDLPNLARRLLETFLVFKVPDKNSLHSRLQEVNFAEPRKTRLLRFVDTHSHAEQISEGHDEASALAEAPTILRDLLDLIEQVDSDHHTRMIAAMVV
jgi:wobble nucleotide-excising tRNase